MIAESFDFNVTAELQDGLRRFRVRAGAIGVLGMIALTIGAFISPD